MSLVQNGRRNWPSSGVEDSPMLTIGDTICSSRATVMLTRLYGVAMRVYWLSSEAGTIFLHLRGFLPEQR